MPVCEAPIKAEVARFTLLDACGAPVFGDGSAQVTTDSFIEIQNSPNYEEGTRFLQRKANGEPCVNEQDPGFLNWVEQTVNLCTLDVDLIALVTGEDPIASATDFVGVQFGDGLLNARFSKEVWQPVAGQGACDAEGNQRWIYWAFPHEYDAQIQEFTFANDVFTFSYMSKTRRLPRCGTSGTRGSRTRPYRRGVRASTTPSPSRRRRRLPPPAVLSRSAANALS